MLCISNKSSGGFKGGPGGAQAHPVASSGVARRGPGGAILSAIYVYTYLYSCRPEGLQLLSPVSLVQLVGSIYIILL